MADGWIDERKTQTETTYKKTTTTLEIQTQMQNSKKIGDPVTIATGAFIVEEQDIPFSEPFFSCTRSYRSGSDARGSFGKGWTTNIDARIIRGTAPSQKDTINELQQTIAQLDELIASTNAIAAGYPDLEPQTEAIRNEKDSIEAQVSELSDIESRRDVLRATNAMAESIADSTFPTESGNGTLILVGGDGSAVLYRETESGLWIPDDAVLAQTDSLIAKGNTDPAKAEGFTHRTKHGIESDFDANGLLVSVRSPSGRRVAIVRDAGTGMATAITFRSTITYAFSDSGESITEIRSPDGSRITLRYESGMLGSVTDGDGDTTKYEYDGSLMTAIVKPDGSKTEITYRESTKNNETVTATTVNENGNAENFDYSIAEGYCEHTDYAGNRHRYWYDESFRTTREEHDDGETIVNEWNAETGTLARSTVDGKETRYEYDDRGNATAIMYDDGSAELYSCAQFDLPATHTDRDGVTTRFTYDQNGNCVSVTRGSSEIYSASFDSDGNMSWRKQGNRTAENFSYDRNGFPVERKYETASGTITEKTRRTPTGEVTGWIDGEGRSWKIETKGARTEERFPGGLVRITERNNRKDPAKIIETDSVTGKTRVTEYAYDRMHHPVKVTVNGMIVQTLSWTDNGQLATITEGDRKTSYAYDGAGRVISITGSSIGTGESGTTKITYGKDSSGSFGTVIDEDGSTTRRYYDAWKRCVAIESGAGRAESWLRSPEGRIVSRENRLGGIERIAYNDDGTPESAEKDGMEPSTVAWNADGTVRTETDADGMTTQYEYDGQGNVVSIERNGDAEFFRYDKAGRIILTTAGKRSRSFEYAENGRSVTIRDGDSITTTFEFDAWGNVIARTDGEGNTRRWNYDAFDNPISEKDAYGAETHYARNENGDITKATYPDGMIDEYAYDRTGNLVEKKTSGKTTMTAAYNAKGLISEIRQNPAPAVSLTYDGEGRLTREKRGGDIVQSIAYRDNGKKIVVTGGNGNIRTYELDAFGRLGDEKNPAGDIARFTWSDAGSLRSRVDFNGIGTGFVYPAGANGYIRSAQSGERDAVYRDEAGNITRIENECGAIEYEYDAAGLLIRQEDRAAGETTVFSYDKAGRRTKMASSSRTLVWTYGKNGETLSVRDAGHSLGMSFKYDIMGRETCRTCVNGTKQETQYDTYGRVVAIKNTSPTGGILFAEAYLYDEFDRITNAIDERGGVTWYFYDNQHRVVETWRTAAEKGSERIILSGSLVAAAKSAIGRISPLLSETIPGTALVIKERYRFDANGNRTERATGLSGSTGDSTASTERYEYDDCDRLVSAGDTTFEYDRNGNLTARKNLRKTSVYTYNANNRMTRARCIDAEAKTVSDSSYLYDAVGRRTVTADAGGSSQRCVYDGTGFDLIMSGPTLIDLSLATFAEDTPFTGNGASAKGDRYRWIDESPNAKRVSNADTFTLSSNFKTECRYPIYADSIPVALSSNGSDFYFANDIHGSIRAVNDYAGNLARRFDYDLFGTPTAKTPNNAEAGATTAVSLVPPAWTGKFQDTATGLYDYGYRDYTPDLARFTTVDPIRDGSNWYAYTNNDPVNWRDDRGLCIQDRISSPIKTGLLTSASGIYNYYKKDGTYVEKNHKGIDIAAPIGTPVYASTNGVITEIRKNTDGYGNSIQITDDNGLSTRYSHLNESPYQKINDRVSQGIQIGSVGNTTATGASTGPHLDFEVSKNNKTIDPISILGGIPSGVTPLVKEGYVKSNKGGYENWLLQKK